ncbi:hypothetical protein ACK8OR_06525 [Jannaschia sp. KMU-145]|uniref:hypothetical protein n=1 Tax=Jannaschia halovivens TaxID=3388667 RepID=UPI00396B3F70
MDMTVEPERAPLRGRTILIASGAWAGAVAVLSAAGVFTSLPLPLFGVTVGLLLTALTLTYFGSPALREWVAGFGLRRLTALHLWRIPAALAFFHAGTAGTLPPIFVMLAGCGDLVAGLMAGAVVFAWPRSRRAYWAMHVVGMADFVLAVGTGLVLSLMAVPAMSTIAAFPLALIPLFGVTLSGASHMMAFHLLVTRRGL